MTIYNSRRNQIDIAQIAIYNYCFLQIKSNELKCFFFFVRGENRSTRGKTSHSRVENQQTQSTFKAECGNRARATLVEGNQVLSPLSQCLFNENKKSHKTEIVCLGGQCCCRSF